MKKNSPIVSNGLTLNNWRNTGFFTRLFLCGFAGIFTWIIIRIFSLPVYQLYSYATADEVIFAIILIWIILQYSHKLQFKLKKYQLIPIFAFVFILQLVIAFALQINPIAATWDPELIYKATINLSTGKDVYIGVYNYFERYPNNLGLVAVLLPWFKIWGWLNIPYETLTLLLNVILMNISFWLLYLSARRICGEIGSKIALIFGVAFITLSPWVTTFYSDSVGMVFPIAVFYLYLRFLDSKTKNNKWFIVILVSILLGIGVLIKPTVLIIAIAIAIAVAVKNTGYCKWESMKKSILYLLVAIFITLTSLFGISIIMAKTMGIRINSIPVSHYILIGLKISYFEGSSGVCYYGCYNESDDIKASTFESTDEYRSYTYKTIKERIWAYGPIGYIDYLTNKGAWVLGDGTFFAYGEGSSANATMKSNFFGSRFIKNILHTKGDYYSIFLVLIQSVWFSVLFLLLFTIYRRRKTSHIMLIIYLSLFGILLFNLIFEARSRYLYLYIPLFILGAVFAINETKLSFGGNKFGAILIFIKDYYKRFCHFLKKFIK